MSNVLKAGSRFCFSENGYYGYFTGTFLEVIKSFDYLKEAKKFYIQECNKRQETDGEFYVCQEEFEDYLTSEGLCKALEVKEICKGEGYFFDSEEWYEAWYEENNGEAE